MLSRQKLFWLSSPYDISGTEARFLRAVRENCAYHIRHCPQYRMICEMEGFSPDQVQAAEDLARLPLLPTLFFKRHHVASMPRWRLALEVTSSGTSGNFSRVGFDWGSVLAEIPMVLRLGFYHRLVSLRPAHYVVLGYRPGRQDRMGVARTMFGLTHFAPPLGRFYALEWRAGAYVPNLDGAVKRLARWARGPLPVRIVAFPSYLWFGLKRLEELGLAVRLPKGSKILLAGGWKQHYAQEVDKSTLYTLARRVLGVEEENIHEFFGAVEHPIFFNTCKKHHFHIPAYARVIIRDVRTLKPLPMGEVGLVNLITPLLNATPVTSVMTDDLGYLTPGEDCGCGLTSPVLTILGRAGLSGITTCAAGAAQLLGKGEMP
ncbi:MAG: acyl-protein synthetase [Lawsonibacter sp.]|nr:acyl-protein synthetase [Lawsonibacter sp.]